MVMAMNKMCPTCGKRFLSFSEKRRFCSPECRKKWHRLWGNMRYRAKLFRNEELKRKSLQSLLDWKAKKREEKMKASMKEAQSRIVDIIII